jgi:hypothetical protein
MASVVRTSGLEQDYYDLTTPRDLSTFLLKTVTMAYLPMGIPPVLGFDFNIQFPKGQRRLHAVAVTGFGNEGDLVPFKGYAMEDGTRWGEGLLLSASRIGTLYAHDDGVGPYCPILFESEPGLIKTSWIREKGGVKVNELARLYSLLVPLYHQIRIDFEDVLLVVIELDSLIEQVRRIGAIEFFHRIEWDIKLDIGVALKRDALQNGALEAAVKYTIATRSMPHYVWRVSGTTENQKRFEIILDATDLRQGRWLIGDIISYDESFLSLIASRLGPYELGPDFFDNETSWAVIENLLAKASEAEPH